jgi:hypothetical protein
MCKLVDKAKAKSKAPPVEIFMEASDWPDARNSDLDSLHPNNANKALGQRASAPHLPRSGQVERGGYRQGFGRNGHEATTHTSTIITMIRVPT